MDRADTVKSETSTTIAEARTATFGTNAAPPVDSTSGRKAFPITNVAHQKPGKGGTADKVNS